MKSASSITKEYLLTRHIAEHDFTAAQLRKAINNSKPATIVTEGAVSGFLNRATTTGALAHVGKQGKNMIYKIVDRDVLEALPIKGSSTPGSHRPMTPTDMRNCLVRIASYIENMEADLKHASTEGLLAELKRRTK